MKSWEWINTSTGKRVDHNHWSTPPDDSGNWKRVYSVGIGSVSGGGGSKAKTSV